MSEQQMKCLDCKKVGHVHWECKDPEVLAKRQTYWPLRNTNADSFDDHADELKFAALERDIFE